MEFKRNVGKAGLSITEFSLLIKSSPQSVSNYARINKVPKHLAIIATLLGEMAEKNMDFEHLFEKMDIDSFQNRGKDQFEKMSK